MTGEKGVLRAPKSAIDDSSGRERQQSRQYRLLAAMFGLLLAVIGALGATLPAAAAPAVTYSGAISDLELSTESGSGALGQWEKVRISGEWSVPDGAKAGETFGMTLPAEFSREAAGAFTLADPVTGVVLADCVVSAGSGPDMVCTLTSGVEGLEDVGGTFWMRAQASSATTSETVTFDLGDRVEIVDLPGDGGIGPERMTESATPYKYGAQTATDGRLRWKVGVPSAHVDDGGFVIVDALDAGLAHHRYTGEIRLDQRVVEDGVLVGEWAPVDPARYEVIFADDGLSFRFTASGLPTSGFAYELVYFTKADSPVHAGDVFGNRAVVNTTELSAAHTVNETGGGDGSGVVYTAFSITKALAGAQAAAARDAVYTVRYAVVDSDAPAQTLSVPVGQTVTSERVPLGSTFVIEEIDLPEIDGVEWGEWSISGEGVIEADDGRYEVTPGTAAGVALTLTNFADTVPTPTPTPTPTSTPTPTVTPTSASPAPFATPEPTPTASPSVVSSTNPAGPEAGGLALTGGGAATALPLAAALVIGGAVATGIAAKRRVRAPRR